MEILANDNDYKVEAARGALIVTRAEDGKVATIKGKGLTAWFKKNVAEYGAHRLVSVMIQTNDTKVEFQ